MEGTAQCDVTLRGRIQSDEEGRGGGFLNAPFLIA